MTCNNGYIGLDYWTKTGAKVRVVGHMILGTVYYSTAMTPASTPETIVAHQRVMTFDIGSCRALAALGLVDPEAAELEAEAETDAVSDPATELDALDAADDDDPDGLDVGSDGVVALPTNPTPNARVDSPSRAHWSPPIR